jgi:iron complex outermembrane receptor protein
MGHLAILRSMQGFCLQWRLLVLAAWFTCLSSTGSRREGSAEPTQPALPPQRSSERPFFEGAASSSQATGSLEQASGKADQVVFVSPDTGQQGGDAPAHCCDAHALSGKAVRAACRMKIMKISALYKGVALATGLCFGFSVHQNVAHASSTLTEVLVQDQYTPEDPRRFSSRTTLISSEDIRKLGAASVNEAIVRFTGAFSKLNTAGSQDRQIDFRGFGETSASNLVVLVDGVRQNESDMDGNNLSWIPIEMVQSIEITRGGSSVMYGEGATNGVINIITRRKGIGRGGQVGLGFGSFGLKEIQTTLGQEAGAWSLTASGFRRQSNNHRENFKTDEDSLFLQGNWQQDKMVMNFRFSQQNLHSGLPGGISVSDFMSRSPVSYKPDDYGKTNSESFSAHVASYRHNWNWIAEWTHRRKTVDSFYVLDGYSTSTKTPSDRVGLRSWTRGQLASFQSVTVLGLDAEAWEQIRSDHSRIEQNMHAVYGKYEISHSETGLSSFIGARRTLADKQASSGLGGGVSQSNNSFETGISWVMNNTSQIYAYRGNSFRLANSDEYVCYPIYGTCPASPINNLLPQRSQDLEFGYKFKTDQTQQTVRIYQHDLTNEIGLDITNFNNINYDPTRRKGVEWEQSHQFDSRWSIKTNVASRANRFIAGPYAGNKIPAPEDSVLFQLTHAWSKGARLTWSSHWFSAQRVSGDFSSSCSDKIPGFALHDIFYFNQIDAWQWSVGVKNVADKNYYTVRTRCNPTSRSVYPEVGRSFIMSGKYLF